MAAGYLGGMKSCCCIRSDQEGWRGQVQCAIALTEANKAIYSLPRYAIAAAVAIGRNACTGFLFANSCNASMTSGGSWLVLPTRISGVSQFHMMRDSNRVILLASPIITPLILFTELPSPHRCRGNASSKDYMCVVGIIAHDSSMLQTLWM